MVVGCHAGAENGTTWALCCPPFICIPDAVSRVPVRVAYPLTAHGFHLQRLRLPEEHNVSVVLT